MTIWTELFDLEFQLKFVNVKGVKTRCLEAGSGEPLIFLHGTSGYIESVYKNIKEHAKHFHVYVIDMLGHGFTEKPIGKPYTISEYTNHVIDFMDTLGIKKANLSGQSLGGWVAGWIAIEYPEKVNKLVLNTSGGLFAYPEVMDTIKRTITNAVMDPSEENIRTRLKRLILDPTQVTDEMIEIRKIVYSQPEFKKVLNQILALQEMETRKKYLFTEDTLKRIQCPTCVIWTSHDPTGAAENAKVFKENIPNCEFHIMDNCAHWPQYEDASTFNEIHLSFLLK